MDENFKNQPQISHLLIALGSLAIEEHCKLLFRILTLTRKANLKFNLTKTQLSLTSVNCLGYTLPYAGLNWIK